MVTVIQFLIFSLMLLSASGKNAYNLPSNFPRCCIHDPQLDDCLLNAAVAAKPFVRKGIEEIEVPGFGPIIIPRRVFHQKTPVVDYTVYVSNYTIWGLDDYNIREITYNPKTFIWQGTVYVEQLQMNSLYDIQGRLHTTPLEGNGIVNSTMGPITGTFEIIGEVANLNGAEYYNPTETKVAITIDDFAVWFEGLYDEDRERGRIANEEINRNSKMIANEITPVVIKIIEDSLMSLVKPLMKAVRYDELFFCDKTAVS